MPKEQCYGVIVVYKGEQNLFLILQQTYNNTPSWWTFPKGHHEGSESPKETALRELKEETGISKIDLLDIPLIYEEYEISRDGERKLKVNEHFMGFVDNKDVDIDNSEISNYKWATYEEALELFTFSTRKETLEKAQKYLNMVK